jgi:fatty acid desaturase
MLAAVVTAVKFRHLQEVSHFAVHGALFRRARLGDTVTEMAVHGPLGFAPVVVRRHRHVRLHHPNATVPGLDPNLTDLQRAGLRPGIGHAAFVRGVLFPLTPLGVFLTLRELASNLVPRRGARWRLAAFLVTPTAAFLLGGTPLLVFGFVVARLLIYPQLAWMSMLVEHTWFAADPVPGTKAQVEAARCVRLYPSRPLLEAVARALWLPYGDLFHYAHSVHPAVRWNYLPRLEMLLGLPHCRAPRVLFGRDAVLSRLHTATMGPCAQVRAKGVAAA